jgi:hypothetical protein
MGRRLAVVDMSVVLAVQMPVVDVVDMVGMRERDVAAALAMGVCVIYVLDVGGSHGGAP